MVGRDKYDEEKAKNKRFWIVVFILFFFLANIMVVLMVT